MGRCFIAIVLFLIPGCPWAAGDIIVAGGRPAGMGYAGVSGTGLWSVCNNPAGMAFGKGLEAGICGENRFLLPDLTSGILAVTFGSKAGAFGAYACRFGSAAYHELKAAGGYARRFGKKFSAGVLIDYIGIGQPDLYGDLHLVSFEAGMMFLPDHNWSLGIHLLNPVPVWLNSERTAKLPVIFRAGVSRNFAGKAILATEIEAATGTGIVVRAGIEYAVHANFFLRTGYVSDPHTVTAGAGIAAGKLRIDLASSWQPVLGYSAQVSVEYRIGVKNEE